MTQYIHKPVLLEEVLSHLQPEPHQGFVDGTVGQGGHAASIMHRVLPGGRLLAFDRDLVNLATAKERLSEYGDRVVFVHDSYANLISQAQAHGFSSVNGILLDLGYSSVHINDASRGFSFQKEGPLDMRYDRKQSLDAKEIIATWDEEGLARIFRVYGEEPRARDVAKAICEARKSSVIETTTDLANVVSLVIRRHGPIHPATQIFQALRIAVNDELGELERALPQCRDLLALGGRLAIISFHSLEDRLVKQFFKSSNDWELVTKHPITASKEEIKANPRSRSAKLRVAIKK